MRALIFDLDDTLLDARKQIRRENQHALFEAIEEGFQIVIATSRPMRAIRQFVVKPLLQKSIVISLNGAVVHSMASPDLARFYGLIGERTAPLLTALDNVGLSVSYSVETDGHHFATSRLFDEVELWEAHSATSDMVIPSKILDLYKVTKIAVDGHGLKLDAILELAEQFPELRFIPADDNTFVNIVPAAVDKSLTLNKVARSEKLDLAESYVFGDDIPDIEMFNIVGNSVAMANAKDAVKHVATHIAGDCNSDAIAVFVRENVL